MSKHTPGPWYAMIRETGGIVDQATIFSEHQTDGEDTFIADTMGVDENVPLEQRRANALLMAAGLEMLAALHSAVNWFTPPNDSKTAFPLKQIADAIAKAEDAL